MITKEMLEKYVPSLTSPTEDIFLHMQGFFDAAETDLKYKVGSFWDEAMRIEQVKELAQKVICLVATYAAIPHLDLVVTDTGFGVVSNQNVVPASAQRVAALKEAVRQQKSTASDLFFQRLLELTEWGSKPEAAEYVTNIVWSPSIARSIGLSLDGHLIFDEEYMTIIPQILQAEAELQNLISPELYNVLVENLIRKNKKDIPYLKVLQKARAYIAAKFYHDGKATILMVHMLELLDRYADALPEYRNSSTYSAHHSEPYKNRKDDGCFFFG